MLTRTHGKQTFMARGIRKNNRDGRRSVLAGFHTVEIEGSARSEAAMLVLTRAEIIRARHHLPLQGATLAAAQVLQETLNRLTADADPCPGVFDLSASCLDLLDAGAPPLIVLPFCLGRIIHLMGYGWRLDGCAACGRLEDPAFFSVKRQQIVCRPCGTPYAQRLLPVTEGVFLAMHRLNWPPDLLGIPLPDAYLYYRITINCLARMAGGPLLTDGPFRAMMAKSQFSNTQEQTDDRQGTFGNSGVSPMQRGIGAGGKEGGTGLPC